MDIRAREWASLKYLDSEKILRGLREVATSYPLHELPYEVAALRRRDLRPYAEGRQAALFCYAMSHIAGAPVWFAQAERSDFDIVARYVRGDVTHFVPVQLKELVPARVNPRASLQTELDKISKYVDSTDLIVAFHVNSDMQVSPSDLRFPTGVVSELWFYGATAPDQVTWVLIGDMLKPNPRALGFVHPGT